MALIDTDYQKQLKRMHIAGKFNNGAKAYGVVKDFIAKYKPTSLLDFGCGQGGLIATIDQLHPGIELAGYDPGNPVFASLPNRTFDVVISTDAIEHIEPEFLQDTFKTIGNLMQRGCIFTHESLCVAVKAESEEVHYGFHACRHTDHAELGQWKNHAGFFLGDVSIKHLIVESFI